MIEGLEGLNQALQEDEKQRANSAGVLYLRGGEAARIRFLTDGPKIITAWYHNVPTGRVSKAGQAIFGTVYCGWDEGEDCAHCAQPGSTTRFKKMNAYVWVYTITHADGKEEAVNGPRVLQTGPGKGNYISTTLTTYLRKYTTLADRDYEWRRTGESRDNTVYSLIPEEKTPIDVEIRKAAASLPELSEIVKGTASLQIAKSVFGGEAAPARESATAAPRPGAPSPLLERLRRSPAPKAPIGEQL